MNLAAIVLCGGTSRRMGVDKASLDFHGAPMLVRVVRLLADAVPVDRIVCVAANKQALPTLAEEVRIVLDREENRGPLEGLATGLDSVSATGPPADAVFVTTCDAPLLVPELPSHLASMLGQHDAVVPRIEGQLYPLTAMYRPQVLSIADARLARGERRVIDFVAELNTRYVTAEELRVVDPGLLSLRNCNTREEYEELLGLSCRMGQEATAPRTHHE